KSIQGSKYAQNTEGVFSLIDLSAHEAILSQIEVGKIWGIGRAHEARLCQSGFKTVWQFRNAPEGWVRQQMGIVGIRLQRELRGFPCSDIEPPDTGRKNIVVSRSFAKEVDTLPELIEAIANHTMRLGEKLRQFDKKTRAVSIFLKKNRFKMGESGGQDVVKTIELPFPTADSMRLIAAAKQLITALFCAGCSYKKTGIMALNLVDTEGLQTHLFEDATVERKREKLMHAVDTLNRKYGKNTVRSGVTLSKTNTNWQMKASFRSPQFTTVWEDILKIKVK
ncbi:MAG: DUF4113 domain-containing protein, partial [Saprospiraceae bacterium]|nr:DUF4113 domain-containing protein [Saprospiraceae bacterium]